VPLQWTGDRDANTREFRERRTRGVQWPWTPQGAGRGEQPGLVRAAAGEAEFFDPTMHAAPLRRIAEETGGRFYTPDTVSRLAENIRYAGRGVTALEERELWNMPIVLLGLMGLLSAEWGYRRLRGLS
jgi:hypothetical protein